VTQLRCGGIIARHFTTNLLMNLLVINLEDQLRFGWVMDMSLVSPFLGSSVQLLLLHNNYCSYIITDLHNFFYKIIKILFSSSSERRQHICSQLPTFISTDIARWMLVLTCFIFYLFSKRNFTVSGTCYHRPSSNQHCQSNEGNTNYWFLSLARPHLAGRHHELLTVLRIVPFTPTSTC